MATQSASSFQCSPLGRMKRRRMILEPASPFHTSQKRWLWFCQILMSKSTWSPSGHSEESSPIQRTDGDKSNIVYKINCYDCDASYVGETGRALKTRVSEHCRAVEKRDFSASVLAQYVWEDDHHINWTCYQCNNWACVINCTCICWIRACVSEDYNFFG